MSSDTSQSPKLPKGEMVKYELPEPLPTIMVLYNPEQVRCTL